MSLSERLRPGVECAPWVVDEVKLVEQQRDEAIRELDVLRVGATLLQECVAELECMLRDREAEIARLQGGA